MIRLVKGGSGTSYCIKTKSLHRFKNKNPADFLHPIPEEMFDVTPRKVKEKQRRKRKKEKKNGLTFLSTEQNTFKMQVEFQDYLQAAEAVC